MPQFKINHVQDVQEFVELQEPVWWNADRTKLLAKGDPDAAFAYGGISTRVPLEQAKADGLVSTRASSSTSGSASTKPAAKKTAARKTAAKSSSAKAKAKK